MGLVKVFGVKIVYLTVFMFEVVMDTGGTFTDAILIDEERKWVKSD